MDAWSLLGVTGPLRAGSLAVSEVVASDKAAPIDLLAVARLEVEYPKARKVELLIELEGDGASERWQLGPEGPFTFC